MKKGTRAAVASIPADSEAILRLAELGLTEGAEFTVVKVAPLGDPIEIDLRGYRLCLRKAETEGVRVRLLEVPAT